MLNYKRFSLFFPVEDGIPVVKIGIINEFFTQELG
jgi:hypothetical protein